MSINTIVLQNVLFLKQHNAHMNTLKNKIHQKYIFRGVVFKFFVEIFTCSKHTMAI